MNYKRLLVLLSLLILIVSGCSNDTNKADLNKDMFKEGKNVVKLYAKTYNGEDKGDEASEASKAFLDKYREDAESKLPVNELLFVQSIELLRIQYASYYLRTKIEELGNGSNSDVDEAKEAMRETLIKIRNNFGISLE